MNLQYSDLIDGDRFEDLACRLNLAYYETHAVDRAGLRGLVLSHNSDGCIVPPGSPTRHYDFVWRDIPESVSHWFGQNVDVVDERLTPIPIGLERVRWYPDVRKHETILDMPRGEKTGLLYLNANTRIVAQRKALYRLFEGLAWVTAERGYNALDFPRYCRQITRHKFVLCPDGNGLDTHRIWETLYLGSFPVVSRHVFSEYFAERLPLLIVDDWTLVTEAWLNEVYARFIAREWDWAALTFGYWEKLIGSWL